MKSKMTHMLVAAVAMAGAVSAHAFPQGNQPIKLVVPFANGGPTGQVAQDFAEALKKQLPGNPITVTYLPGGGGALGAGSVVNAKPDGHTLLVANVGLHTLNKLQRVSFDPSRDLEPVGAISDAPMVLVSTTDINAQEPRHLQTWFTRNKTEATFGHRGSSSVNYLCGLAMQKAFGNKFKGVLYNENNNSLIKDLESGKIQLACEQSAGLQDPIKNDRIRAYAVTGKTTITEPPFNTLPTMEKSGFPDVDVSIWHGIYAPKGTPAATLDAINIAVQKAARDPEFVSKQARSGVNGINDERSSRGGHKSLVTRDTARWEAIIHRNEFSQ